MNTQTEPHSAESGISRRRAAAVRNDKMLADELEARTVGDCGSGVKPFGL
jgi:hypothetical protein